MPKPKPPEELTNEGARVRAQESWTDEARLPQSEPGGDDGDDGGDGAAVDFEPRDAAAAAEDTSWSLADLKAAGRVVPESRQERERQQSQRLQTRKALAASSVAATRAGDAMRAAAAAASDAAWVRGSRSPVTARRGGG